MEMLEFQFTRPVWGATGRAGISGESREFQFTRPVWGATSPKFRRSTRAPSFNSRAPCGARLHLRGVFRRRRVSIHAPRVGRDLGTRFPYVGDDVFQFTRPVWGATKGQSQSTPCRIVSIHAPRVGRDPTCHRRYARTKSFNSRAPCGARLLLALLPGLIPCFNSRAPCGARPTLVLSIVSRFGFNSRAPCGARRYAG